MLIYKILNPDALSDDERALDNLLDSESVVTRYVRPSSLSFLTSLRVAAECKRSVPDAVLAFRLKDVIGAISARDLTRRGDGDSFKVVYMVDGMADVPRRIPTAVMKGIDCWVFPSEESEQRYREIEDIELKSSTILHPTTLGQPFKGDGSNSAVLRVGPIDNTTTLSDAIGVMKRLGDNNRVELRVLGTGKARDVMPLVKQARAYNLSVRWLGDEYDLEKELSGAGAILVSDNRLLSPVELRAMAGGLAVLKDKATIEDYLSGEYGNELNIESSIIWEKNHRPQVYVDRLKKIIKS